MVIRTNDWNDWNELFALPAASCADVPCLHAG